MESRGNIKYGNKEQIGVEQVAAALHYAPSRKLDRFSVFKQNNASGFHTSYHTYGFSWDESGIKYFIDDVEYGDVPVADGFWKVDANNEMILFK